MGQNVGQTLMISINNEQCVYMIDQGLVVAKPVVSGLNGQYIVVVEDGIRNEVLQWGREHAPEIDPLTADRIEVLRGPNSLIYGSDALGGVISVTKITLHSAALGEGPFSANVVAHAYTVNNILGKEVLLS